MFKSMTKLSLEGEVLLEEQIGLRHLLDVLLCKLLVLLQLLLCPCPLFLCIFNFLPEVVQFTLNSCRRFSYKLLPKLNFI
jgi:hypothetical protein